MKQSSQFAKQRIAQINGITLTESANTPRDAKAVADRVSGDCFNDEIRAHVAWQILKRILTPHDPDVAKALTAALLAAGKLVGAYDGQYRD